MVEKSRKIEAISIFLSTFWNNDLTHSFFFIKLGIITIELLDGEPISSSGLIYQYKVRKSYQPFKVRTKKSKPEKPASPKTPEPVSRRSFSGQFSLKGKKKYFTLKLVNKTLKAV